jgi:hypothetical protein
MAKISTYPVDGIISTDDFVIGSDAENSNITKNFTVGGLLSLATLQVVLDNGNSATSNMTLVGNVSATNVAASVLLSAPTGSITTVNSTTVNAVDLNVSASATLEDVEVAGLFYDGTGSEGTSGQFLKSTGVGTEWDSVPVDTLQEVLTAGNTTTLDIVSTGDISADTLQAGTGLTTAKIDLSGLFYDQSTSEGTPGQVLTSNGTGVLWDDLPAVVIPTLDQVLTSGNTTTLNIVSTGDVDANSVNVTDAAVTGTLTLDGTIEADGSEGTVGQYLRSAGAGQPVTWATLPPQQIAGWNRFDDDQYTSASPLEVFEGAPVVLPNDGVKFSDSYGSAVFYNPAASEILAINEDDTYIITVMFKAVSSNAANSYMDLSMSGPAGYDRVSETLTFPKGNGVPHNFHRVYQYYADADFITNGAQLEIEVVGATVEVYDIIYFIQRVQIA